MQTRIVDAQPEHTGIILGFIRQLAIYEKLENEVVADEASLMKHLFEQKSAQCCLAFEGDIPVGFALYFFTFSTFLAKQGLYLEDLFVDPTYRGKGHGKALLLHLASLALQQNCGRMEWSVLNWNQSAIDFYESIGAKPMRDWTVYRITEERLKMLDKAHRT